MSKRMPEEKLAEIRRLWRSMPDTERRKFLKSSAPRLSDDLLLEVLAIVSQQIHRRDLGSYGCQMTLLIIAEALTRDVAIESLISFLDDCLALPAVEVSND